MDASNGRAEDLCKEGHAKGCPSRSQVCFSRQQIVRIDAFPVISNKPPHLNIKYVPQHVLPRARNLVGMKSFHGIAVLGQNILGIELGHNRSYQQRQMKRCTNWE